ncbi:PEGA domain-containing protein [Myxococcota bacterium]|nr:PEGA domain-containing protein [Myxococcota bacterium]
MRALILGLALFPSAAWAASGSVDVKVSNAPGEIILDGIPTGVKAPAVLSDVPVGSHQLELEYGCMVGSATVDVTDGQTTVVELPLQNVGGTGMLRFKNLPNGAEVVIDGAEVARVDEGVSLRCGARTVEIEAPGYEPFTTKVIVTSAKRVNLDVAMTAADISTPAPKPPPRPVEEDEDDEPMSEPDAGDDELDSLDEPDEPPSRGGRDDYEEEPEEDEEDEEPIDEDEEPIDEEPDFDDYEEDEDYERDPDELDEDEDIDYPRGGSNSNARDDEREGGGAPVRALVVTGFGAGAVGGIIYGASVAPAYRAEQANYEALLAAGSNKAQGWKNDVVDPLRKSMMTGYALGGVAAGAAVISFLVIPAKDSDVMITPTHNGGVVTVRF